MIPATLRNPSGSGAGRLVQRRWKLRWFQEAVEVRYRERGRLTSTGLE